MYIVMLFVYALFVCSICINAHPQCLDSDPPFKLKGSDEVFCQRYKTLGCCNRGNNGEIEKKYNSILEKLNKKGIAGCESFLKDILCQTCSPYAAHVFEIEPNFPELCSNYCSKLYDKCQDMIPYVTDDQEIINSRSSKELFCGAVGNETIYCWPDIIENTDLNKVLNRTTNSTEGCVCLKEFANGLRNPMRFKSPNDGTGRIFILEQGGLIWIYSKDGVKVSKPFLDISKKIKIRDNRGNENGLIGLEFHPEYKSNRKFYIHYTVTLRNFNLDARSIISEMTTRANNMNKADLSSERIIFKVDQPTSIHNAGELLFGIDGYLYIFLGDGGPSYDQLNHGQDRSTLLGSILRVDVSNSSVPYRIPSDNPFVGIPGIKSEIFAYGVRNPWRGDVDEGDSETGYGRGRMLFGDVGQVRYEELDVLVKGANYGWRPYEGTHCAMYPGINQPRECKSLKKHTKPIKDYSHSFGNAVVPGHIYRGCHNPALNGLYIFGFHFHPTFGGEIYFLKEKRKNSNEWESNLMQICGDDVCYNGWTNIYGRYIMGFGEDDDGEIYLMSSNTAILTDKSGKIQRIVDPRRRGDPDTCRSKAVDRISSTKNPRFTTTTFRPSENIVAFNEGMDLLMV